MTVVIIQQYALLSHVISNHYKPMVALLRYSLHFPELHMPLHHPGTISPTNTRIGDGHEPHSLIYPGALKTNSLMSV